MLDKELLNEKYYFDRMSMFLKESYGVEERIYFLVKILKRLDYIYTTILDELNLNNDTFKTKILDFIGELFKCNRNISIKYLHDATTKSELSAAPITHFTLNDKYFLLYIKTQIVKQNFDGTQEEIEKLYSSYDFTVKYNSSNSNPLTVTINWENHDSSTDPSNILGCMFLNGLLTIESMGIVYDYALSQDIESGTFGNSRFGYSLWS